MDTTESTTKRGSVNVLLAPAAIGAVAGGLALMIGRSKPARPTRRPEKAAKGSPDPKVQKAVETAQRALEDARQQLASRDLTRRAGVARDSTREAVAPVMKDAGERARVIAERLRVESQARSADINQRLRADVAPKAKSLAQEAVDEAEEIIRAARKRAAEVSSTARNEYGPDLAHGASGLAGLVAAGSSAGYHMLRERSAKMQRQSRSKRARRGVMQRRARTAAALQSAGGYMKSAATESVLVTFWASACAATVYFTLLSQPQRDRLKKFVSGAISQIKDVMTDFNEVGEEFSTQS